MKGKGKKEKEYDVDECPLQYLDFKPIDHTRQCPRFTSVLQRTEDESITSEDLDALQLELETLLVSVVMRQRLLETETEALMNWYDHKNRDKRSPNKSQFGKRGKQSDDKPSKKFKTESNSNASTPTASSTGKSHTSRPHKMKNISAKFADVTDFVEPQHKAISKQLAIKNDIPNQFWQFIEPYCQEISSENIKFLNDLIKSYDDDGEYYKVPNLGKHYSVKWELDGNDQSKQCSPPKVSSDKKKGLSAANSASASSPTLPATKSKKGSKNSSDADKSSFGALTQRLVSCLIEENLLNASNADHKSSDNESNGKVNNTGNNSKIFKSLNLGNTVQLERRIRKELEEHGILTMDDILSASEPPSTNEDEILQELKRCQTELKAITAKNQTQLKRLLSSAKKEVTKQELSKKLQTIDTDIIETYRKLNVAKQKKKSPTKKEKDNALKAIKERESLIKQIESLSPKING